MSKKIVLEPAAQEVSNDSKAHPRIYELVPTKGREVLEQAQSTDVEKAPATDDVVEISTGEWGTINVHFIRPVGNEDTLPVIFYIHGAGWVFGSEHTHDKLVRELAARTQAVVVVPEYTRSPEAKYPTAIEQNYAVLQQLPDFAAAHRFNVDQLTVAGDSVGGNMAIVMTLMTKKCQGLPIQQQLLYYPVTDANFETESYIQFADGYYLTKAGMEWFWNQYTNVPAERAEITASPLRATLDDLKGLPAAMILNGEADVLRDEGEAYANKLREAGVPVTQVQFQGMIHDFVMLNSLDQTHATRAAMDLSTTWLNERNHA
ncbi:alpha/beta hydrolase [Furfurilactobacillus entadae]|uniref:alpha/beta hydrolase n=1 Tax=Furfurilactobacillus entadae TaxID=2922307 RepID=UPI0035EF4187